MRTTNSRPRHLFDRSSLVAYAGTGAAIVFIFAMTMGAIDTPAERNRLATSDGGETTRLVSVVGPHTGVTDVR